MNTNKEDIINELMEYIYKTEDNKLTSASYVKTILYKIKRVEVSLEFRDALFKYYKDSFEEVCNEIDKIADADIKHFSKITKLPPEMRGVIFIWQWLIKPDEVYEGLPNINKYFQTINMNNNKKLEIRKQIRHSSFAESNATKKIKIS